jgi:hypothetical protein
VLEYQFFVTDVCIALDELYYYHKRISIITIDKNCTQFNWNNIGKMCKKFKYGKNIQATNIINIIIGTFGFCPTMKGMLILHVKTIVPIKMLCKMFADITKN